MLLKHVLRFLLCIGSFGLFFQVEASKSVFQSEGSSVEAGYVDPWAPWRSKAKVERERYVILDPIVMQKIDGVLTFDLERPSYGGDDLSMFKVDLSEVQLGESGGVEYRFSFKCDHIPPGKMKASHTLAQFKWTHAEGRPQRFTLHTYNRRKAFMLNHLAYGRRPKLDETLLARGVVLPSAAPYWDAQWHQVKVAWGKGRLVVTWDGLVVLDAKSADIDYRRLEMEWLKPSVSFGEMSFKDLECHRLRFL